MRYVVLTVLMLLGAPALAEEPAVGETITSTAATADISKFRWSFEGESLSSEDMDLSTAIAMEAGEVRLQITEEVQ